MTTAQGRLWHANHECVKDAELERRYKEAPTIKKREEEAEKKRQRRRSRGDEARGETDTGFTGFERRSGTFRTDSEWRIGMIHDRATKWQILDRTSCSSGCRLGFT